MIDDDDEMSKDKEIDKLMALISLSFKKIYKPINNNLRTSSNTSRANQDNSPRINKNAGYESQRSGNVVGARETVGSSMVQKSGIQCYNCKEFGHVAKKCQKPKRTKDAAYHREKMLLYTIDSGPVFDTEPEQKVQNDDHYNVFAIECQHPEQSESVHETYPIEQDAHNVIIESTDMNYNSEQIDQNDEDADLSKERLEISIARQRHYYKPQLKSNPMEDRVLRKNSLGKKQKVEDHRRNVKLPKNKTSHDMCVLTSVTKPIKRTVASESNKKPRNVTRKIYEHFSKTCSWWYPKSTPSGYIWKPKSGKENVNPNVSMPLGNRSRTINDLKPTTSRRFTVSNTLLSSNSLQLVEIVLFIVDSGCSNHMTGNLKLLINFVEKFLGTVKFGNDQIAPILGYGDLVQGAITIK
nr:integrase, catalytic region, zinc finger, CCHC-type, peptidase aspartic, catalytic [Tanacetum cinerariifolium]